MDSASVAVAVGLLNDPKDSRAIVAHFQRDRIREPAAACLQFDRRSPVLPAYYSPRPALMQPYKDGRRSAWQKFFPKDRRDQSALVGCEEHRIACDASACLQCSQTLRVSMRRDCLSEKAYRALCSRCFRAVYQRKLIFDDWTARSSFCGHVRYLQIDPYLAVSQSRN